MQGEREEGYVLFDPRPCDVSLLVRCHKPSKVRAALFEPGGDNTALN